jgi:hypothetical protein
VLNASGSPRWVRSPAQATYPSGRINTAVGAVTAPSTGKLPLTGIFSIDQLDPLWPHVLRGWTRALELPQANWDASGLGRVGFVKCFDL